MFHSEVSQEPRAPVALVTALPAHTGIPEQGMLTSPVRDPRLGWHQAPQAELEPWTHNTTSYGHHSQVWFSGCEGRTGGPSCQAGSHLNHPTSWGIPANWLHWGFSSFFNANRDVPKRISLFNLMACSSKPACWTELRATTAGFHLTPDYSPNHSTCLFFREENVHSSLKHPIVLSVVLHPTQEISINQTICCNLE